MLRPSRLRDIDASLMDGNYIARLPLDLRNLVETIERDTEIEISVTIDASRERLGCNIERHGAEILVPPNDYFPAGAVLHELLHIKRLYLDGVPRISFCDDCDDYEDNLDEELRLKSGLVAVDNNLEHLVIVPIEVAWLPERRMYWKERMRKALAELATDKLPLELRRGNVLEHSPFVRHVLPDEDLLAQLVTLAADLNMTERAAAYSAAVVGCLDSKVAMVRVWMEYFTGHEDIVCLEYFDIQNRTSQSSHVLAAE